VFINPFSRRRTSRPVSRNPHFALSRLLRPPPLPHGPSDTVFISMGHAIRPFSNQFYDVHSESSPSPWLLSRLRVAHVQEWVEMLPFPPGFRRNEEAASFLLSSKTVLRVFPCVRPRWILLLSSFRSCVLHYLPVSRLFSSGVIVTPRFQPQFLDSRRSVATFRLAILLDGLCFSFFSTTNPAPSVLPHASSFCLRSGH